jgi:rhodanese-related sulfurtransferase
MFRSLLFAIAFTFASQAIAEPQIMSAPDAASAVDAGEMILIDIRTPGEWSDTGVASGAIALTMHSPEFGRKITELLAAQQDKTIGLICATGGRTEYVVSLLAENGYENVIDVSEGMMGNGRGPGWIARGMPLVTAAAAQEAYEDLVQER